MGNAHEVSAKKKKKNQEIKIQSMISTLFFIYMMCIKNVCKALPKHKGWLSQCG